MNLVISMPKTGKAYSKKLEQPEFLNKRIGEEVDLGIIGLEGYKAKITGGSDKDGFPMRNMLAGTVRKKLLVKDTVFRSARKGERKRLTVRGNTVDKDIHQLNLMITQVGKIDLDVLFGNAKEREEGKGEKEETKTEGKEKAK